MNPFMRIRAVKALSICVLMTAATDAVCCGDMWGNAEEQLDTRVVHFAPDSADIPNESYKALKAHAHFLHNHPDAHVELIGNTDNSIHGDYAVAIGTRMASAVKVFLELNGARSEQIEVVSHGSARPLLLDNSDEARSGNRRVEIHYTANAPESR